MGGQQSRPTVQAPPPPQPTPAPPPPPPDPATQCRLRGVELNQITQDLTKKQQEVDSCDPQGAQTRLVNAELARNNGYVDEKRAKFNELLGNNRTSTTIYQNVRDAVAPLVDIGNEVSDTAKKLDEQSRKYVQLQRKERRTFLDTSPLAGVGGIPGVRTDDDWVLLSFWIALGLALVAALTFYLSTTAMDLKQKIGTGVGVTVVVYGLVYMLITRYG